MKQLEHPELSHLPLSSYYLKRGKTVHILPKQMLNTNSQKQDRQEEGKGKKTTTKHHQSGIQIVKRKEFRTIAMTCLTQEVLDMADCKQDQQSTKGSLTPETAFPSKSQWVTFCNKKRFSFFFKKELQTLTTAKLNQQQTSQDLHFSQKQYPQLH